VEWKNDVVEQYNQKTAEFTLCGNHELIVARFSDGREYSGQHKDFSQFHGFGIMTSNGGNDGPQCWKGEVLQYAQVYVFCIETS